MPCEFCIRLLNTLNIDVMLIIGNVHRVETANRSHGITHLYVLQLRSNCEVLQFVEDEVEFIAILRIVNPDKSLAE